MSGRGGGSGPGPRDAIPPGARTPPPTTPVPPAPAGCPGGGNGPIRRVVRVVNPHGLHPRLADRFIRTASQYSCKVTLWNGETRADGKNIFDLILLVVLPDSDVILEVEGADAPNAVELLAEVLGSAGGEDYTI